MFSVAAEVAELVSVGSGLFKHAEISMMQARKIIIYPMAVWEVCQFS
jgi:hypothetical protein